jgi:hypothetical protein
MKDNRNKIEAEYTMLEEAQ